MYQHKTTQEKSAEKYKVGCAAFPFCWDKKENFRERYRIIYKKCFENVTVKGIADLYGIRQSAVYNHFPSKQKILNTIYDYYYNYSLLY